MHFAFINSLQKYICLVDRGVEHFWCQFRQKGSKFWRCPAHSNKLLEGFALLTKIKKGVPPLGTSCAKTLKGFAFLATCSPKPQEGSHFWREFAKGFALLNTALPKDSEGFALLDTALAAILKSSHFRTLFGKGSHFFTFSGLGANGSQFSTTSGTKQKR